MKFLKKPSRMLLCFLALMLCLNFFAYEIKADEKAPTEERTVYKEYIYFRIPPEKRYAGYNDYRNVVTYQVEDEYYVNFHDIAYLLGNSYAGFDIKWNHALSRTELTLHSPYTRERSFSSEIYNSFPFSLNPWWAKVKLWIDNEAVEVSGFVHDKQFYMSVKDLGNLVGFSVVKETVKDWTYLKLIPQTPPSIKLLGNIEMSSVLSDAEYVLRWGSVKQSYLYQQKDKFVALYFVANKEENAKSPGTLYKEEYDLNFKLLDRKLIKNYGELFGGFYHGKKYNYLVFGNNNPKEDNNKAVLTVVQMDHEFKEIKKVDVKNCYTVTPFNLGSLSMAEHGDLLTIHTSRLRYRTPDGLNHQSQLTVGVDTKAMKVLNAADLGKFQKNHVSHSFNQYVLYDEKGKLYLVDHGDAYPRSIVVHKMDSKMKTMEKKLEFLKIKGEIGANQTGVFVGDVEQSKDSLLVGINKIDFKKANHFDSYEIYGEDVDRRDAYVYIIDKNLRKSNVLKLTDYTKDKEKTAYSAPYIVKLDDKKFAVLWMKKFINPESKYENEKEELQYVIINEKGERLSDIKTLSWHFLGESKPIFVNGKIYTLLRDRNGAVALSTIDIEE